jgi:hypothetical protein
MEHNIVNKYSNMIAKEVNRYKNEMLDYFHAREINANNDEDDDIKDEDEDHGLSSNANRQSYTTSLARIRYELEGYTISESDLTQKVSIPVVDDDDALTERTGTDARTRLRSVSYDPDQQQTQTFITEDTTLIIENEEIPFSKTFRVPSHIVESTMLK